MTLRSLQPVPKWLGNDTELGNTLTGKSNWQAAALLLAQLEHLSQFRGVPSAAGSYQESGRHFLPNGSCCYVDLGHLEIAVAETLSSKSHAAAFHAMLRIVRACYRRARRQLPEGQELFVNASSSDSTYETVWGPHLNVAVARELFDSLFDQRPHLLASFASFLAATVPVFGQGLVLPLDGGCRYVTSQRAHHIGLLVDPSTTVPFRRPLVNSRDESHADGKVARLHIIVYDANLQPVTIFLRCGLLQLFLAAMEIGWFDSKLLLDHPVQAVRLWSSSFSSHTGTLQPRKLARPGLRPILLYDWHRRLLDQLGTLVSREAIAEEIVPHRQEILDRWADTLDALITSDHDRLIARLDWALKWRILSELVTDPNDLSDPQLRLADQYYSHVDERLGLFWELWREGIVERVFDDEAIGRFVRDGDPQTRSGLRAELIRRLRPWIDGIDWSYIDFRTKRAPYTWGSQRHRLWMTDLAGGDLPSVAELRRRFPKNRQLLDFVIAQSELQRACRPPSTIVSHSTLNGGTTHARKSASSP